MDSQDFDIYVPVYDSVPDQWEDARGMLTENMKKLANVTNNKVSGWYLANEAVTGKRFIPTQRSGTSEQYRTIFRKVVDFGAVAVGANAVAHGITVDANFSLIQLYGGMTDSTGLLAFPVPNNNDSISLTSSNILINSTAAYDRCFVVIEYIKEI